MKALFTYEGDDRWQWEVDEGDPEHPYLFVDHPEYGGDMTPLGTLPSRYARQSDRL